ncbi:MAG: hypothetical protein EP330_11435 [Deltaproteobacteria bacterium]|nr:MAG: hypothetical protein EP330_11435 [Deltaproteobacteria bacterium]
MSSSKQTPLPEGFEEDLDAIPDTADVMAMLVTGKGVAFEGETSDQAEADTEPESSMSPAIPLLLLAVIAVLLFMAAVLLAILLLL